MSAGRYLAKDAGVTVQLSRVFKNGVTLGAFFSKTNVSSAQFGEGSFDKGVFVSIPFDAFLTRSSNTVANFVWKPLTRDGGAKLGRSAQLYDLTGPRSDRTLRFESAPPPNHATIPADRRDAWTPLPAGPEPYLRVSPKPAAEQWTREASYEHRLEEALYRQEFRNIRIAYDGSHRLTLTLSNDRIRPLSRAAGRAARTALPLAPLEVREIRITLAERIDPLVTYDFFDLPRLERYFNGAIGRADLADYVAVAYIDPSARQQDPLERLDDLETDVEETRLADVLVPASRSFARVRSDFSAAGRTAAGADWLQAGAYGAGMVVASAALDRRIDRFAADHESNRWVKGVAYRSHLGRRHALRARIQRPLALRGRRPEQYRARGQPRTLVLRHRGRKSDRLRDWTGFLGVFPHDEKRRAARAGASDGSAFGVGGELKPHPTTYSLAPRAGRGWG